MNFLPEFLQDIQFWKQLALLTSNIKYWRLKTWTAEQDKSKMISMLMEMQNFKSKTETNSKKWLMDLVPDKVKPT